MFSNMTSTTQRDRTLQLLGSHGLMRLTDLKRHCIHAPTLSRLVEEGSIARRGRGMYELTDAEVTLAHSLAEIAVRVPKGVICLISALQYHEITLQAPRSIWVAIGENDHKPKVTHLSVRFMHFGDTALQTGIETVTIDGVQVKIFSVAKTVVDCFRYRRKVGLDVALEALRLALRSHKTTPDDIAHLAKQLRIWTVIRPYLESAMADDA